MRRVCSPNVFQYSFHWQLLFLVLNSCPLLYSRSHRNKGAQGGGCGCLVPQERDPPLIRERRQRGARTAQPDQSEKKVGVVAVEGSGEKQKKQRKDGEGDKGKGGKGKEGEEADSYQLWLQHSA